MSNTSIEETLAVALAYGQTESMAALGAMQSKTIQELQTGRADSALWAVMLSGLGRNLIAYKSRMLIAEKADIPAPYKKWAEAENKPVEVILKTLITREQVDAIEALAGQIKHVLKRRKRARKLNQMERMLVAAVAIDEWAEDYCRSCHGAGEIPNFEGIEGNQPTQVCPVCDGKLKHKYTDKERESAISLKNELFENPVNLRETAYLVKAVTTTRAIIRLSIKTCQIEYARNC
jgi:hypothetical protein